MIWKFLFGRYEVRLAISQSILRAKFLVVTGIILKRMNKFRENLFGNGCGDRPSEWMSNPAKNKTNEKELVPGVGD
jgi:hypothetical protein